MSDITHASTGEYYVALSLVFDLIDILCQVPCASGGVSFLLQGFLPCPFLKSGSARIAIVRFTLLNDVSRWALSFPNYYVVSCALGELDGVIRSHFSNFPQIRLFLMAILGNTTRLNSLSQRSHCSFPPLVFDFLLGCSPASVPEKTTDILFIRIQTCKFMHTGGCHESHDGSVHFSFKTFFHAFLRFNLEGLPLGLPFL